MPEPLAARQMREPDLPGYDQATWDRRVAEATKRRAEALARRAAEKEARCGPAPEARPLPTLPDGSLGLGGSITAGDAPATAFSAAPSHEVQPPGRAHSVMRGEIVCSPGDRAGHRGTDGAHVKPHVYADPGADMAVAYDAYGASFARGDGRADTQAADPGGEVEDRVPDGTTRSAVLIQFLASLVVGFLLGGLVMTAGGLVQAPSDAAPTGIFGLGGP